mgnify:CR=1 FL=1
MTGCASTGSYFVDRGRDAADIFTATVGVGLGTQARVGPIHAGLGLFMEGSGLRGGALQKNTKAGFSLDLDGALFPAPSPCGKNPYFTSSAFNAEGVAKTRGKGFFAGSSFPFITTELWPIPENDMDYERHNLSRQDIPYFTQIDLFLAVAGGFRLGFNPGELLDFILGWTTIDIFKDDLEAKNRSPEEIARKQAEETATKERLKLEAQNMEARRKASIESVNKEYDAWKKKFYEQ